MFCKSRVLLVDDEPRVLAGLCRLLRKMRRQTDIVLAQGGQEALDRLAEAPFDVIVTDVHMPGVGGAQLLTEVMEQYPQTVRIVLSGTADKQAILQVIAPAHQFLRKPCDGRMLRSVLTRACTLRNLLKGDTLREVVARIKSLPSLPSLCLEIAQELRSTEPSLEAVGRIVSLDIGMTAKVLQLANSAFFGSDRHISAPSQAVAILGLTVVKALAIPALSPFDQIKLDGLSLDSLTRHSVSVGMLARDIARAKGADQVSPDQAYSAGLLHDIGILILATSFTEEYQTALDLAVREGIELREAEREVFGATHEAVGAYLLGLWGLPEPLVLSAANHHNPTYDENMEFRLAVAVSAANVLERKSRPPNETRGILHRGAPDIAEFGQAQRIPVWREVYQA